MNVAGKLVRELAHGGDNCKAREYLMVSVGTVGGTTLLGTGVALGVWWLIESLRVPWNKWGTFINVSKLMTFPRGALPPLDLSQIPNKSYLHLLDQGVKRIHDPINGGLGIFHSFYLWHWALVPIYFALFALTFYATTPVKEEEPFPWLTFLHKLFIWFNAWEALGLGVIHGPLHGKFNPPFLDWWYR